LIPLLFLALARQNQEEEKTGSTTEDTEDTETAVESAGKLAANE
jgi:hypothetical protein